MPPPEKTNLSAEERRIRQEGRLKAIRLRMAIWRELEDRNITTPATIGEALGGRSGSAGGEGAEGLGRRPRHQVRKASTAGAGEASSYDARVTPAGAAAILRGMSQPPDKPKLTREERRVREADRLRSIRLRVLISRELDDRGITDPAAIGTALGMPGAEATKLLIRHQWREGDVALLEAAAARLGVRVPDHSHPGG